MMLMNCCVFVCVMLVVGFIVVGVCVYVENVLVILCIGYQKLLMLIMLFKMCGMFEQVLMLFGLCVLWYEFVSGLLLIEVFNVGVVDFSVDVVDMVLVFVQVVYVCFVYIVQEVFLLKVQVIIVKQDSLLCMFVDFKG